jgi:hypothetical protein
MEPIANNVLYRYLYSGYDKVDGYLAIHIVPIVASGIGGLLALLLYCRTQYSEFDI